MKNAPQENLALVPLLAYTNENAFLFITPLMVIILGQFNKLKLYEKVIFIAGIVLQGGNIRDMGKKLCDLFLDYSVVSIGAILILIILFISRYRNYKSFS